MSEPEALEQAFSYKRVMELESLVNRLRDHLERAHDAAEAINEGDADTYFEAWPQEVIDLVNEAYAATQRH